MTATEWTWIIVFAVWMTGTMIAYVAFCEWREHRRWKAALKSVLREWAESCDWQGYAEMPDTMYENLCLRIEDGVRHLGFEYPSRLCRSCGGPMIVRENPPDATD